MDDKIRDAQQKILKIFSKYHGTFALSGGTALELYYLHHRFSKDLDFFSPEYSVVEIEELVSKIEDETGENVTLESEFKTAGYARVRFYSMPVKGTDIPLKIDFVEDVIIRKPNVMLFDGVPAYDVENIYVQKIAAVSGTVLIEDITGREISTGRREVRDAFDIYMLSKKIRPLHEFLLQLSREQQRGLIQWHHSFSRQDLKIGLLDLDIYDAEFDASEMLNHIDDEINKFVEGVLE